MDATKRKRLVARLNEMPEPPVVPVRDFFDGNDDAASIGCNLSKHPGMDVFREILEGVAKRPDVVAVYAQISEVDPGEDYWPFADGILVVGAIARTDLVRMLAPLKPDEVELLDRKRVPATITSQHQDAVLHAWWD